MCSSVKNSCERDIGVYGFNPEHLTLRSKEGGHEAGSIEAQSTSHWYSVWSGFYKKIHSFQ